MTLGNLMKFFEQFYGEKYSGIFEKTMHDYLSGFSDNFYQACAEVVVKKFSRIYNKVPDPAIVEKNMDEIWAIMPKPEYLPEPEIKVATHEEATEYISQMKQILSGNKAGPMSSTLAKTVDEIGAIL